MEITMTEQAIRQEIHRLAPFHHDVELAYGLRTQPSSTRLSNLIRHAWPSLLQACGGSLDGQSVLDVACNCGGFSVEAAKGGAEYVLGIDIVDHYLEQANFIKNVLGLNKIEFRKVSVEDLDEESVGQFDISFCFGILYHFENPVLAMKKLSSVTRRIMLVDTTVIHTPLIREPVWAMRILPPLPEESRFVTSALWRTGKVCQFVPNTIAVVELLKLLGFENVKRIKPTVKNLEKRYYQTQGGWLRRSHRQKRVAFLAVRESPI